MDIDNKFVEEYDGLIIERINRLKVDPEMHDHMKAKIYERILTANSYDPDKGKLSTWLWNVCRSVIANEEKKHARSTDVLDHQPIQLDDANNIIGEEDAGSAADMLDGIIAGVNLSERNERILRASQLEDYSSTEIADNEGMEIRAVQQVIYRAMKALRDSVRDDA